MAGTIIQFPSRDNKKSIDENQVQKSPAVEEDRDDTESSEAIDLGEFPLPEIPQIIMEVRTFVDMSKGAQLVAFIDVQTKTLAVLKGSAVFPVKTPQGIRGIQVEIDFPVEVNEESFHESESDLMDKVKAAFDSYDVMADEAIKSKQKELEEQNRIVSASGLPFDPKGTSPFKKK